MKNFISVLKTKLGLDRAISYVLIGRGISLISQPITIFFIGRFLSSTEQGFYYTFANIISLNIFLELGLGTILTQFASHEFAYLNWNRGSLEGASYSLSRLLSLGRKTFIWYSVMAVIFTLLIIPVGINFFKANHNDEQVHYVTPWICLVLFSAVNLILYAFTSILEGCARVSDVQLMKLIQSLIANACIWILLFTGMGLFAAAALAFVQVILTFCWIRWKYWPLIRQIIFFDKSIINQISWKHEIIPLQWKIGLSWISGYIIFQAVNPMLFKYRGPIEAGQMGMSMSISNLAAVIGMAWLTTKVPGYGSLINQGKINLLKQSVKKNTIMAIFVAGFSSIFILIALMIVIKFKPDFGKRILPVSSIFILIISSLINIFINSLAAYLRAFKKEPFLISSLCGALLTGIGIYFSVRYFDANVLVYVLLILSICFGLPVNIYIFKKQNRLISDR